MNYGISREEALGLLKKNLSNPNMIKHCLASEAVMRHLARHLGEDEEKWALAGLLHDLDAENQPDMKFHTLETVQVLTQHGVDDEIIEAIRLHNDIAHDERRSKLFHYALAAGETVTGLVTATALVYPDKKLSSVKPKSVRKRFKEKAFARGADRNIIMECEQIGLDINTFCDIALQAMQEISDDLGL